MPNKPLELSLGLGPYSHDLLSLARIGRLVRVPLLGRFGLRCTTQNLLSSILTRVGKHILLAAESSRVSPGTRGVVMISGG